MPRAVGRAARRGAVRRSIRRGFTVRAVSDGWIAGLGQPEDEAGDAAGVAGEVDLAAVLLGQAPGRGQAESPAPPRAAAGIEGIEHVFLHGRRWARAVVFDDDLEALVAARLGADAGPAFGRRPFDPVPPAVA